MRPIHISTGLALLAHVVPAVAQVSVGGVSFIDRSATGTIVLGTIRGAAAVLDYDQDGWMDLFIAANPDDSDRLFRNVPDPADPGRRTFQDVTASSGLAADADSIQRPGGGALAGDVDNDGYPDLYVIGFRGDNLTSGVLYHNNGDGTFTNVSVAAGVRVTGDAVQSASLVDFDLDGHLDLFLASTVGSVRNQRLLRNNGGGTFSDASEILPEVADASNIYSHLWSDFDGDGDQDCNLLTTGSGSATLLRNDEGPGGRVFTDVAALVGYTVLGPAPMGIAAGDMDNDGDFDLAITDAVDGTYYRNDGGVFVRITPMDSIFGWGICWLDADNDGDLDNYQCGSYGRGANYDQLFRNEGGGVFTNIFEAMNSTFSVSQHSSRVDWNNDGRVEMVTVHPGTPGQFVSVYENVSTTPGHWLTVRLRGDGVHVNRDAVGAVVRLTAGGLTQHREIINGSSTTSTEDLRAHFGLGPSAAVERIEVLWPRRGTLAVRTQVVGGPFAADQIVTIDFHCPSDFNGDGFVDGIDADGFNNAFEAGAGPADINGDGFVDGIDYDTFFNAFEAGC